MKDEALGKLKDLGNSILGNFGMSLDNFKMAQDPTTGSWNIRYDVCIAVSSSYIVQHEQIACVHHLLLLMTMTMEVAGNKSQI